MPQPTAKYDQMEEESYVLEIIDGVKKDILPLLQGHHDLQEVGIKEDDIIAPDTRGCLDRAAKLLMLNEVMNWKVIVDGAEQPMDKYVNDVSGIVAKRADQQHDLVSQ